MSYSGLQFIAFVFALVVLSRVIILTEQIESVQKVILDVDKMLDDLKTQVNEMPNKTADQKKN